MSEPANTAYKFWFDRARILTGRMLEAVPAEGVLTLKHTGGSEPMNGLEWFEGYGGHEAFHHRQIDALLAKAPPT